MTQDNAKVSAAATAPTEGGQSGGAREAPGHVQVMTDEHVEVLRKQISIYATICNQLLEMHNAQDAARQGSSIVAGGRFGRGSHLYGDPPMGHGGKKIAGGRRRWAPTQTQMQILETIFGEGHHAAGALPRKQEITDITAELSQHGQVAEANVYNWFQNRRARAKRRRGALLPNEAESETQRWAPTQMQLQILETVLGEGIGAPPRKQEITDITAELSQHGQVAEANVYIWFQNRRARAKRDLKRRRGELL